MSATKIILRRLAPALLVALIVGAAVAGSPALAQEEATPAHALAMHGVMLTSQPSLLYWEPGTLAVLKAVQGWRREGLEVYFTMDAGPNVHCLCPAAQAGKVEEQLRALSVTEVIVSGPGQGVRLVDHYLF